MRHLALSAVAALALLGGCQDKPHQTPTEPPAEAASSAVSAPDAVAGKAASEESTLCAAYRGQLREARAALARQPGKESLQETVATFEMVIADACN